MSKNEVPASTRIRPSRVHNIDTDRLQRRHDWLTEHAAELARNIDGPDNPGGRKRLRELACEVLAVENELAQRIAEKETET